jgi:hypothetical protein
MARKRQGRRKRKVGGFLPLIPAIIGAIGTLAGGAAGIASAVNQSKTRKLLQDAIRAKKIGAGIRRKRRRRRGRGLQLYPWSSTTPWLMSQSKKKMPASIMRSFPRGR